MGHYQNINIFLHSMPLDNIHECGFQAFFYFLERLCHPRCVMVIDGIRNIGKTFIQLCKRRSSQPVRLIAVQSREGLAKIGKGANLYGAPLAVIVCADHGKAWVRPFDKKQTTDIDASILTDHMMLQATELGLGSVWICYFKPDVISREFGLSDNLEPVNILAIGYSDEEAADPERHSQTRIPVEELVSYETV